MHRVSPIRMGQASVNLNKTFSTHTSRKKRGKGEKGEKVESKKF
jgi:hypothetical protein